MVANSDTAALHASLDSLSDVGVSWRKVLAGDLAWSTELFGGAKPYDLDTQLTSWVAFARMQSHNAWKTKW